MIEKEQKTERDMFRLMIGKLKKIDSLDTVAKQFTVKSDGSDFSNDKGVRIFASINNL